MLTLLWLLGLIACSLANEEHDIYTNPELANFIAARFPLLGALMGREPTPSSYPVPIILPLVMVNERGFLEKFCCKHKHKDKKGEAVEGDQEEHDGGEQEDDGEYSEDAPPPQPPYPLPPPPPYYPTGYNPTTTVKPVKTTTAKPVKTTTKPVKTTKKPPKKKPTTTAKPTTTTTTPCPAHHPEDHEDHHHHEEYEPYPYPPHPPGYPAPHPPPTTTTTTTTTAKPKPTKPLWWSIFTTPKPKSVRTSNSHLRKIDRNEETISTAGFVPVEVGEHIGEVMKTAEHNETEAPEDTTLREELLA